MTIDVNDMLQSILESISRIDYIHPKDVPNIDLYMDQVTTFMENQLASTKRHPDDKILTKTMINNYTKNNLLPPPDKKKYSQEHVLLLAFIYYFKNILAIKDIESLLQPMTEKYFHKSGNLSIAEIYEEICSMEKAQIEPLQKELTQTYERTQASFGDVPEDERNDLQFFAFICSLSFDVYVKKLLVEKLLDGMMSNKDDKPGSKKK